MIYKVIYEEESSNNHSISEKSRIDAISLIFYLRSHDIDHYAKVPKLFQELIESYSEEYQRELRVLLSDCIGLLMRE